MVEGKGRYVNLPVFQWSPLICPLAASSVCLIFGCYGQFFLAVNTLSTFLGFIINSNALNDSIQTAKQNKIEQ